MKTNGNTMSTEEKSGKGQSEYGLPKTDPKPIDRGVENIGAQDPVYKHRMEREAKDDRNRMLSMLLTILLIVAAIGAAYYWFNREQASTDEPTELSDNETTTDALESTDVQDVNTTDEIANSDEDSNDNLGRDERGDEETLDYSNVGSVTRVDNKTNLYYVIISSNIDEDIAMDNANKLAGQGLDMKVLQPVPSKPYYRVAVAEYQSVNSALDDLPDLKSKYGSDIWVLKY